MFYEMIVPWLCSFAEQADCIIDISSVESQKGVIAVQRCSVENQKGAIAIDFVQQ